MKNVFLLLFAGIFFALTGCDSSDNEPDPNNNDVAGYLYTTTNGEGMNQVVRFDRLKNGNLNNEMAYSTNSQGGSNTSVGGDAHGDYDFQGSMKIIGNYLLAVNSGGNNVSVFALDRSNGNLSLKNNINSGGKRPVSITTTPVAGSNTEFWLVVGNQWDNPNIQKDPPNIQRFPNDAFFMQDLTQPDASDQLRNIQLFRFDSSNGNLTPVSLLDTYVRENGRPCQALCSPDGTKLAVSLWGIAHFGGTNPLLTE